MDKRLYSPAYVKEIINKHGFSFSKSLGQNFLIDGNIVRKIVEGSEITKDDYVIEIGPGIGTLTEELSLRAKKVIAIEIDKTLIPILEENLGKYDNIEIINGDILKVDLKEIIETKAGGGPVKVVANLPYYITTPIITMLIEGDFKIESITVMIQKEVADRIVGRVNTKDYGSLTIFTNYYCQGETLVRVPKTVFMPQPKIDSSVIRLKMKEDREDIDTEEFFKMVRGAFSSRRKTLINSLYNGKIGYEKEDIKKAMEKSGLDEKLRPEDLSLDDYLKLFKHLKED